MSLREWYFYKEETFTCSGGCGWTGLGSEIKLGEMVDHSCCEAHCPKCGNILPDLLLFPTLEEQMEFGSESEKISANERKQFLEKLWSFELKNISQLPDLQGDLLTFVLTEVEEEDGNFIVITESERFVWKEMLSYEYYDRFIELGELLKQKYGARMIDFVPPVNSFHLYGDKCSASGKIENFRKNLRHE
ncbi:MAG: hypothetical protein LBN23_05120 [Paludibacter sp.]|jgi:hypothetical protein|nr:hypothetical protein [Paludibacter sp.]